MALSPAKGLREEEEEKEEEEEEEEEEAEREEEEEEEEEEGARSHLPLAPSSELLDLSTTVDPSYIISLIRQLLPNVLKGSSEERNGCFDDYQAGAEETKDPWEECGCILWDLAASKIQAELMVNNLVLEVLLANLQVSKSFRVKEICLGIIGNLACHEVLSNAICSKNGLIETVVDQLHLDDSSCLAETFRLLAVGLQGSASSSWAEALLPDEIIQRVLWIVGNTLNSTLFEKGIDFLLTVIDNQEVGTILLQPLMKLGLLNLVISLLTSEIKDSGDENKLERCPVLDLILRLVEALSAIDSCSQVMSSNEQLLQLVCSIVKLSDKFEVSSSCVSAVVIIANLLGDEKHLMSELSHDILFLQGLFDILPLVSDEPQARNALWCILARLLVQVQEDDISLSSSRQFPLLLLEKSYVIEEDLESHPEDKLEELAPHDSTKLYGVVTASLRRIGLIMEKWIAEKSSMPEKDVACADDSVGKAQKLLTCCWKYSL
ncbi:uncharacterized protein [Typha latifolia]|uniref:uncharacterized protein isoform X2 n=1 Tax=Typha latifolia TaxID=4733 RepID=UPI003C2DD618